MQKTLLLLFIFMLCHLKSQQKTFILTDIQTKKEYIRKDSASAAAFLDSLSQDRYYLTKLNRVTTDGNKTVIFFDKGKNFNEAWVAVDDTLAKVIKQHPEFFTRNLDSLKKSTVQKLNENGYAFGRIQTRFLKMKNGFPQVKLTAFPGKMRKIDRFVLKGYEKVPKRFVKNLGKEYTGKIYNARSVNAINTSLQNHPFVLLEKPPQTLFTKDSTHIYLFLQKKKSNTFDGVLGFGNDKNRKFSFNGNLNVGFRNLFNGFEEINLYWQRNPDRGQTFNLHTDIPYLFKTNTGLDLQMNIFRQDSTFATVKMLPSFYYHLNSQQKIGLRGTFESSAVLDSLYVSGKDYTKKGIGVWYSFTRPSEVELILYKTNIQAEFDVLSTKYAEQGSAIGQTNYFIFGEQNIHLSGNHYLNLKGESALINGKTDLQANELLRFGGWNSMRGFNENTLYADFYAYGGAEYRYLVNNQAFFDVFGQYAQLNNKNLALKPKLYSLGFGFNFFLPVGLMSFQISNGSQFGSPLRFSDTKIHWGILSRF